MAYFDPTTAKTPVWEQQECDTSKSFAIFCCYRGMGPSRTLEKVATQMKAHGGTVLKWYGTHGWKARVAAYDEHMQTITQSEIELAYRMKVKEEAKKTVDLIFKAKRIVEHDLSVLLERAEAQQGENREMVLDRATAVKLLDRVTILERLTTGASTENLSMDDKSKPRTIKHIIVDAKSDKEEVDDE